MHYEFTNTHKTTRLLLPSNKPNSHPPISIGINGKMIYNGWAKLAMMHHRHTCCITDICQHFRPTQRL